MSKIRSLSLENSKDSRKILRIEKDDRKIYIGSKYNVQRDYT